MRKLSRIPIETAVDNEPGVQHHVSEADSSTYSQLTVVSQQCHSVSPSVTAVSDVSVAQDKSAHWGLWGALEANSLQKKMSQALGNN